MFDPVPVDYYKQNPSPGTVFYYKLSENPIWYPTLRAALDVEEDTNGSAGVVEKFEQNVFTKVADDKKVSFMFLSRPFKRLNSIRLLH
jgi:hypothetical protein